MRHTRKWRNGCVAAGAVVVGILAGSGPAAGGACVPTGPGVDRSSGAGDNPWGQTAVSSCSPFGYRDIGRKH